MRGPDITEIKTWLNQFLEEEQINTLDAQAKLAVELVTNLDQAQLIDGVDLEIIIRSILLSEKPEQFTKREYIDMLVSMQSSIGVLDCVNAIQNPLDESFVRQLANSDNQNAVVSLTAIIKQRFDFKPKPQLREYLKILSASKVFVELQAASNRLKPKE